jgi:hypothetical protein
VSREDLMSTEAADICRRYRSSLERATQELVAAVNRRPPLRALFDNPSIADRDLVRRHDYREAVSEARQRLYYSLRQYRRPHDGVPAPEPAIEPADAAAWARRVLAQHASTAERMADYPRFFSRLHEVLPDMRSGTVVDFGCGVHPLAYLAFEVDLPSRYIALDRDRWSIDLLDGFAAAARPSVLDPRLVDVTQDPARHIGTAGVGIMLKFLTVFERTNPGAATALLDVPIDHLVVTGNVEALAKRTSIAGRERRALRSLIETSNREIMAEIALPSEFGYVLGPRTSGSPRVQKEH